MFELNRSGIKPLLGAIVVILAAIFGNYAVIDQHIMGVVPTYYRVTIPVMFILCLAINYKNRDFHIVTSSEKNRVNRVFFLMGAIWIIYGIASMLLSQWSVFDEGAKEILSIVLGLFSVYIVITLCAKGQTGNLITVIKIVVVAALAIGYFEVFSGWHMPTSMLNDPRFWASMAEVYPDRDMSYMMYNTATGMFYNPNDYCAFLSVFAPVFFFYKKESKLAIKFLHYIAWALVFLMNMIDSALLCTLALLFGLATYLILTKAKVSKWIISVITVALVQLFGNTIVNIISKIIPGSQNVIVTELQGMVSAHAAGASQETSSVVLRMNTYIESTKEMFTSSKGLGFGAGSYSNYFAELVESRNMLINPHAFWIELLSQYGAIIFLVVVITFIYIFIKLFISFRETKNPVFVMVMAMGVCFIFASIAPSSYLKGSYYWIIFGLALGFIEQKKILIENQ